MEARYRAQTQGSHWQITNSYAKNDAILQKKLLIFMYF